MVDWSGTPYKVKQVITIEMNISNKDKHKVINLVKKNYETDVVIFKDSNLIITNFGEGRLYQGDYWNPDEYDDNLYYDEVDIMQLLEEHNYEVINKWEKCDYEIKGEEYED